LAKKTPTCHKVFLLLEKLQSTWEHLSVKPEYDPVKDALEASLKNMEKWYRKTDDTSIYFVCHGIVSYEEVCFTAEQVLQFST
jgi:hypothetical protein